MLKKLALAGALALAFSALAWAATVNVPPHRDSAGNLQESIGAACLNPTTGDPESCGGTLGSGVDGNGLLKTGPDGLAVSGSATSATTLFTQDMTGYESITVQTTSAGSGNTITYETSDDNFTTTTPAYGLVTAPSVSPLAQGSTTNFVNARIAVANDMFQFPKRGRYFRARVSTYGSGTVSVVGTLSKAPMVPLVVSQINGQQVHDIAVAGNPVRTGRQARSSNYTAVQSGDQADDISTLVGASIQKPYSIPEADWSYAAAASGIVNTTTAVTIAAAAGAGLRNYVTAAQLSCEALTNATEFAIRDGAAGTVIWRTKIGTAGLLGGRDIFFPSPLKSTANTLLEVVTLTASGAGACYFDAQGYIAP